MLKITGGDSTVRGLVIDRFGGSGIELRGSANNTVVGNVIGTNRLGTVAMANGNAGISVVGSDFNTIGGTTLADRNLLSGNNNYGVSLSVNADNNVVRGNYIGTTATGDGDLGNDVAGVDIRGRNNQIGGAAAGARNVISGNNLYGVRIYDTPAHDNVVQGNYIGVNAAGSAALANGFTGVYVVGADFNTIGGTTVAARNVISANAKYGVHLSTGADDNLVQGNYIGLNAAGTGDLGNGVVGVDIRGRRNQVGGLAAGVRNIISGNGQYGVRILDPGAHDNLVASNRIGTNAAGTAAVGNDLGGLIIQNSADNIIGGTGNALNVISGNNDYGVRVLGAGATGNQIVRNRIGTNLTGTAALGTQLVGVDIRSPDNIVGGPSLGNIIAFATFGVRVVDANATGNRIQRNSIFGNGIGIDLGGDGATNNDVNDPDAGPNRLQNFPVIVTAVKTGDNLSIDYSVPSIAANSTFPLTVEFYIADGANRQGKTLLGATNYISPGTKTLVIVGSAAVAGDRIVAIATDAAGNTSEFSVAATIGGALQAFSSPAASSAASAPKAPGSNAGLPGAAAPAPAALGVQSRDNRAAASIDLLAAALDELGPTLSLAGNAGAQESELLSSLVRPGIRRPSLAQAIEAAFGGG